MGCELLQIRGSVMSKPYRDEGKQTNHVAIDRFDTYRDGLLQGAGLAGATFALSDAIHESTEVWWLILSIVLFAAMTAVVFRRYTTLRRKAYGRDNVG